MIKRLARILVSLAVRGGDIGRELIGGVAGRVSGPVGVVLYYHAIKAAQRGRFARQMDWLCSEGRPWQAERIAEIREPGLHVAVTFDDGFVSVMENALPELRERGIPFTVFIPTGSLGRRPTWIQSRSQPGWEERVMEPEELRCLALEGLVTVGSHSVSHADLVKLDPAEVERELRQSKTELEAMIGREITLFSYPHGRCSSALNRQARSAGYRYVFTVEPERIEGGGERFAIGRVLADPDDWLIEFWLKLRGAYRWQDWLHRLNRPDPE